MNRETPTPTERIAFWFCCFLLIVPWFSGIIYLGAMVW